MVPPRKDPPSPFASSVRVHGMIPARSALSLCFLPPLSHFLFPPPLPPPLGTRPPPAASSSSAKAAAAPTNSASLLCLQRHGGTRRVPGPQSAAQPLPAEHSPHPPHPIDGHLTDWPRAPPLAPYPAQSADRLHGSAGLGCSEWSTQAWHGQNSSHHRQYVARSGGASFRGH